MSLVTALEIDGEAPLSRVNRESLRYWTERCGSKSLASRADLDPAHIVPILPYVMLIDVPEDPADFRFRLVGTKMVELMRADYTGRWMSDIPHLCKPSRTWTSFRRAVKARRPLTNEASFLRSRKKTIGGEEILLPLSDDGIRVNMLFVTANFIGDED